MSPPLVQDIVEFTCEHQSGPVAVPLHVHHFFQMDVILGGSMDLRTRSGRITLKQGDGTLIPPLLLHGFNIAGHVHHATFKFHMHPRYSAIAGHALRILRFDEKYMDVAEAAGRAAHANEPMNAHFISAAAVMCLVHAMRESPPAPDTIEASSNSSREMWEVLNEVMARPHANWSVHQLAQRCHLSEGHFTKKFVHSFGQTPRRFLLEARIWGAAGRLNRDNISIKAMAESSGYATVHSFSRAFKRAIGVSPAAYVRSQGQL